jgi:hypothetical protein
MEIFNPPLILLHGSVSNSFARYGDVRSQYIMVHQTKNGEENELTLV